MKLDEMMTEPLHMRELNELKAEESDDEGTELMNSAIMKIVREQLQARLAEEGADGEERPITLTLDPAALLSQAEGAAKEEGPGTTERIEGEVGRRARGGARPCSLSTGVARGLSAPAWHKVLGWHEDSLCAGVEQWPRDCARGPNGGWPCSQGGKSEGGASGESEEDKGFTQAGCTAVCALVIRGKLVVANAGDSRAVLCRGGTAVALTQDHKPTDDAEMRRIVRAGGEVRDGRVNGALNLSRALGDMEYKLQEGLKPEEQMITAVPEVRRAGEGIAAGPLMRCASVGASFDRLQP